jgi:hypothetical protein
MVYMSSNLKRYLVSNTNCNDDKFSHHLQKEEFVNNVPPEYLCIK